MRLITLIAIDPGDTYCGVAFFSTDGDGAWSCMDAQEMGPDEFEDGLARTLFDKDSPDIVVYERFRLYEDKAIEQKGSEFRTSQCIGVIKFMIRQRNLHCDVHEQAETEGKLTTCELRYGVCADPGDRPRRIEGVGQLADIQKSTAGILRKRKIKSVAKPIARERYGGRDHVISAELHGWHHIIKTIGGRHAVQP